MNLTCSNTLLERCRKQVNIYPTEKRNFLNLCFLLGVHRPLSMWMHGLDNPMAHLWISSPTALGPNTI